MGMNVVETPATAANGSSVNGKKKPDQERNWRQLESERDTLRSRAEDATRERDALQRENRELLRENESLLHENDGLRREFQQAYARGREDMKREIAFSERLARARAKFADFDVVWQEVRSQVPRAVLEEIGALANGLDAGYYLRRNPTLCAELVGLPPEQARIRFRNFAQDLVFFGGKA